MIPLYDTVRSHKFPFITIALIGTNLLVFLYERQLDPFALQNFIYTWGLIPRYFTADFFTGWLFVLTSMFLHGGWLHLLSNMWVLYIFGNSFEASMGGFRYLFFYIQAGAAAAFLQVYIRPASTTPMIGASGAFGRFWAPTSFCFPRARIARKPGMAWWDHIGGFIFGAIMVSFFAIRKTRTYGNWQ